MYILLENVQGFENSVAQCVLIDTLNKCRYRYQEFLLSPQDFGVPNSRLRYYMIASLKTTNFSFSESPQVRAPNSFILILAGLNVINYLVH